jgi:hypothetical protein
MENKDSKKHKQYKSRPRIEDFVSESDFDGEIKNTILDFASYLRINKMPPQWAAINSWKFLYKKERIGYIRLIDGFWYFDYIIPKIEKGLELYKTDLTIDEKFEEYAAGENLQEYILDNVKYCTSCISIGHCSPKNLTIFGKDFKNLCWNGNLSFKNPAAAELEQLKKLYDYLKKGIETL